MTPRTMNVYRVRFILMKPTYEGGHPSWMETAEVDEQRVVAKDFAEALRFAETLLPLMVRMSSRPSEYKYEVRDITRLKTEVMVL